MEPRRIHKEMEPLSGSLRIGVLSAYPAEDWHAQRIAEAARRHGIVELLQPTDFGAEVAPTLCRVSVQGRPSERFDLFLTPRALGDSGDPDVQIELYRLLSESGARVVNEVQALLLAIDKLRTSVLLSRAGLPSPRVFVVQNLQEAEAVLAKLGRMVAKPLYGSLGRGVELVTQPQSLPRLIESQGALYLQEYLGEVRRDLRAFVIGGHVEAAIVRRPPPGEFRANLRFGALGDPTELDRAAAELAVRAVRILGLDYGGVDLVELDSGPQVIEVNGTPGFRGIYEATGRDMATPIVEHAISLISPKMRKTR
jgi:tetrahydromethanopterin:alpha-L-glutamate ligase